MMIIEYMYQIKALLQKLFFSGADQMTKLRRDVGVVQQNCRILSEMLTEVSPGNENAADKELLKVAPINTYKNIATKPKNRGGFA